MEFYEWIIDGDNFSMNVRNDKQVIFNNFINDNKDFDKLKRNNFNIWVHKYANYIGKKFEQDQSNGLKWFGIFDKEYNKEEDDNDIMF